MMKTPKIVIADLDGTIALIEHRRHWLDAEGHPDMTSDERWRTFFAQCHGDLPNWPVISELSAPWHQPDTVGEFPKQRAYAFYPTEFKELTRLKLNSPTVPSPPKAHS
jgi:hypothetical protein